MLGLFVPTPNQNMLYTETGYKKGLVKTIVLIQKLGKTLDGFLFLKRARRDSWSEKHMNKNMGTNTLQ